MAKQIGGTFAATPYARALAKQRGIDLSGLSGNGPCGEIRAAEVLFAAPQKARITPLARRMAAELKIETASIAGSGYLGKVFSRDLDRARAIAPQAAAQSVAGGQANGMRPMSGMRRVIAKRMFQSHSEIPSVTQNIEVDVTELMSLRAYVNEALEKERRISVNDFILKAVGIAVREQERFRMQLKDDAYVLHSVCNVGMAVGMDEGLLVPVIRDADEKSLSEISAEAKVYAAKARQNKLLPEDVGSGVITVSNMGMYGTHSFTPIINQPEASILGVNAAIGRLVLTEQGVAVRKIMLLSLTYDHRIINGTEAAAFEKRVKELLESPAHLLDKGLR